MTCVLMLTLAMRGFSERNVNSFFRTVNGRGRTRITNVAISAAMSRNVSLYKSTKKVKRKSMLVSCGHDARRAAKY